MTAETYEVTLRVTIEREIMIDDDPDLSWLGVRAAARSEETGEIVARSSGLWGIESDSGEDYLTEVFEQERDELLTTLGVKR